MLTRSHENTFASIQSLVGVARAAEGTAQALGLPTAIFTEIAHLFDEAVAKGLAKQDGSSLVEVLLQSS
jgi:3-hydroxyisobutyrate dehydrogenase-like beta-hydroxyacid dehydrogenase